MIHLLFMNKCHFLCIEDFVNHWGEQPLYFMLNLKLNINCKNFINRPLCPAIVQFHYACLRSEIFLRHLQYSRPSAFVCTIELRNLGQRKPFAFGLIATNKSGITEYIKSSFLV